MLTTLAPPGSTSRLQGIQVGKGVRTFTVINRSGGHNNKAFSVVGQWRNW